MPALPGGRGPKHMSEAVDQSTAVLEKFANQDYKWGFVSDIESDTFAPGLSPEVIVALSKRKEEPEWMLEWRLKAYRHFLTMKEPHWPNVKYPPINLQEIIY